MIRGSYFQVFLWKTGLRIGRMSWIGGIMMVYHGTSFSKSLLTDSFLRVTRDSVTPRPERVYGTGNRRGTHEH